MKKQVDKYHDLESNLDAIVNVRTKEVEGEKLELIKKVSKLTEQQPSSPVKNDTTVKHKDIIKNLQQKIYDLESQMEAVVNVKTQELQNEKLELTKKVSKLTEQQPSSPVKVDATAKHKDIIKNQQQKIYDLESQMEAVVNVKTQELQNEKLELTKKVSKLTEQQPSSPVKVDATAKHKDIIKNQQQKIYDLESQMEAVVNVKTQELQNEKLELTKKVSKLTEQQPDLPIKDDATAKHKDIIKNQQQKIYDLESQMEAVVNVKTQELQNEKLELTKKVSKLTEQQPSSPVKDDATAKLKNIIKNQQQKIYDLESHMEAVVNVKTKELQNDNIQLTRKFTIIEEQTKKVPVGDDSQPPAKEKQPEISDENNSSSKVEQLQQKLRK